MFINGEKKKKEKTETRFALRHTRHTLLKGENLLERRGGNIFEGIRVSRKSSSSFKKVGKSHSGNPKTPPNKKRERKSVKDCLDPSIWNKDGRRSD